ILTVESPRKEVYPYHEAARRYLDAGAGANVGLYKFSLDNPQTPIMVQWECPVDYMTSFTVEYATEKDFSNALTVEVAGTKRSVALYNLYKGTQYYVRVTAFQGEEAVVSAEGKFKTTDLGPRVMCVDGIHNVRDLGGYTTTDGKRTKQGLIYRGGTLTPADVYTSNITEEGKRVMREVMGIKTEIDFRSEGEAGVKECVIPDVELHYVTLNGYAEGMDGKNYKKLFSMLANEENYPMYIHCTGGADRTGTVSFLFNALLGIPEDVLIQDYEFTSFSLFGERNSQTGTYGQYFKRFRAKLDTYEGESLQEKVESYLLSMGVTEEEITSIRGIMIEE
ncbi:MAG: tyrosine-protein phosphatase, partial [Clostridia bacterium]|nr:tyrosine-protein phosphatase [Clostridia bacterium]